MSRLSLLLLLACGTSSLELDPNGEPVDLELDEQALSAQAFYGISPEQFSFNSSPAQAIGSIGAGLVRFQVERWPAGATALDAMVNAARAQNLAVLLELNYATYDVPGIPMGKARIEYWHQGFTDSGNAFAVKYGQIASEIAARYAGKVAWYEIWNEPNAAPRGPQSSPDWTGACGIGATAYTYGTDVNGNVIGEPWALCPRQLGVLASKAAAAIRAKDRAARIVAGNVLLHGADGWVGKDYWKQVEQSPAAKTYKAQTGRLPWDAVGFHPYNSDPTSSDFTHQIDSFKSILSTYGDPSKLAISEYGWRTGAGPMTESWVSESVQASFVRSAFGVAKSKGLAFLLWFNFQDGSGGMKFGVRRETGSYKPSARAFCEASGALASCPVQGVAVGARPDGSRDQAIVDCHTRNGGFSAAGSPFDNGGGAHVHAWGAGQAQDFQGGTLGANVCMHQNGKATAMMVRGGIRGVYLSGGGALGVLGYPVGEEFASSTGPRQNFEGGYITWDASVSGFRSYRGPNRAPIGNLDVVTATQVKGWAHDPDATLSPISVRIYRNGVRVLTITASARRDDLVAAGVAPNAEHGFVAALSTGSGTHTFEARAIDSSTGAEIVLPGRRTITFP